MAQLIVRDFEDSLKEKLRQRAKANGHSMEEETRIILRGVLDTGPVNSQSLGLGSLIAAQMAELGVTSEDVQELERNIEELRRITPPHTPFSFDDPE